LCATVDGSRTVEELNQLCAGPAGDAAYRLPRSPAAFAPLKGVDGVALLGLR
jgi:hypothetical protein